ncbi:hypothetical protein IFM89_023718, partial [Coptis chinensis]
EEDHAKEPKEENVTSLGPVVRDGEYVFGVVHIFASLNDTFIHVIDFLGKSKLIETNLCHIYCYACYTGNKTKAPGPGAQFALRALARSVLKILVALPVCIERVPEWVGSYVRLFKPL